MLQRFYFAFLSMLVLTLSNARGVDRIDIDVTINSQAVHMALDTGASDTILFAPAAERLKLATHPSKARSGLKLDVTDPVDFTVFGIRKTAPLLVISPPKDVKSDVDGVIGWGPLSENVWVFDPKEPRVSVGVPIPEEAKNWTKLRLRPIERTLWLEVPLDSGKTGLVFVDTGDSAGAGLNPALWKQWQSDHPNAPTSIYAAATVYQHVIVGPECWTDDLTLGSLSFHDLPVHEATAHQAERPDFYATLGLYSVRRMNLVVDGKNGWAYIHPLTTPPPPYTHNRAGVVFVPDNPGSADLMARVIDAGPAFRAGIRDGDTLLKVDSLDVTKWKTDPAVLPLSRFWAMSAGTTLHLTLQRNGEKIQSDLTLQQILGPGE